MSLHNTENSYGSLAKWFHWGMAFLMIMMFAAGLIMTEMQTSPMKIWIYGLHKSTGILILLLVCGRLYWRWMEVRPRMPEGMTSTQKNLAEWVHKALYALMFAIPLSGWAMSNAAGYLISFYGVVTLPAIVANSHEMKVFYAETHEILAYAAIWLVLLHGAAAFWHQFIRKDGLLMRMLPQKRRK